MARKCSLASTIGSHWFAGLGEQHCLIASEGDEKILSCVAIEENEWNFKSMVPTKDLMPTRVKEKLGEESDAFRVEEITVCKSAFHVSGLLLVAVFV